MGRRKLPVCDWTKVELNENKDATGAKNAGEFVKEMRVVVDLWRLHRGDSQGSLAEKCGTRPYP